MKLARLAPVLLLLALLLPLGSAPAQNSVHSTPAAVSSDLRTTYLPAPYTAVGASVNGEGYSPLSLAFGGGLRIDAPRLVTDIGFAYDTARKVNDATSDNHSGHSRRIQGRAFYRLRSGLYFGGGAQWSQTSTTNYTKAGWWPTVGVGKDFLRDTYSFRLQALYLSPGGNKVNGLQGSEISLTYPSPATRGHFFLQTVASVARFHTTDTFSDPVTSARERSEHHFSGGFVSSVIVRF